MVIAHEHPTNATDFNRGLNIKVYAAILFTAVVVIAAILMAAVDRKGSRTIPTQITSPTFQL